MKKLTIFILFSLFFVQIFAQKNDNSFATDAFGLSVESAFSSINQISGDIHYIPKYNRGMHLVYTYSYYPQKNYSLGFTIATGLNIINERIIVPAKKYNLPWDFVDAWSRYIPNISLGINYSRCVFRTKKSRYFISLSPGILSAVGYSIGGTMGFGDIDSFFVMNETYKYIPNPILNLDFVMKKQLKNGNFINISLCSQISFAEKYVTDYQFFLNNPNFTAHSQVITNLSFIGIEFSYEIKEKNK